MGRSRSQAGITRCALAARFADEYNTPFPTLDDVERARARLAEACRRAGRELLPLSVMTSVIVGADDGEVRARARRVAELRGVDADAMLASRPPGWIIGTVDDAAAQLRELRNAGVSRVMCQHLLHDDLDAVALLGRELAPRVA
jgi:alkanesulfonate monooxygenase SsuD/methylene tetrahydromethanopterin reductase-like flavin-dependent oxidoreductase (luciferase family)